MSCKPWEFECIWNEAQQALQKAAQDAADLVDPSKNAFWNQVTNAVSDIANAAGKTVENLLKDPLPLIATVALGAMGVPPSVSQFIVGMAQGKSPEDAAKGALLSYVTGMASSGISGAVQSAIGDAAGVAVSNMLASGAVGTATALLSGSSLEKALAKGAEAALTSQVTQFIKDSGVDPNTIGGKAILDSAKAAMGAIYAGKNIADAVGKAATASMIASGVSAETGKAVQQKDILRLAAANAQAAKAQAAAVVAQSKYLKDPVSSKAAIDKAEAAAAPAIAKADETIKNKQMELTGLTGSTGLIAKAKLEEARLGGPAGATAAYAKNGQKFVTSAELVAQGSAMAAQIDAAKQLKASVAAPREQFNSEVKAYQTQLEAVNKAYGDVKLAQDTLKATSEQIGKYVGSYSDKALKEIVASPAAAKIIADAKQSIATEKATQNKTATDLGFKTYADMTDAKGVASKDYYAGKAGFIDAADQALATSKGFTTSAAWIPQRAAIKANFLNADDYKAAGTKTAPDFYAFKAGFKDAADQAAAKAAGFTAPQSWKDQQAATAAGFKNAADKAAAGATPAETYYANKAAVAAGYKDAAEQKAANGKPALEYRASVAGFKSAKDQTDAKGMAAPDFYAKQAGFKDAADLKKAIDAKVYDPKLWAAKSLGFDSLADQAKAATFKEDAATFKANQPARDLGWANATELKAANGMSKDAFMAKALKFKTPEDYAAAAKAGVKDPDIFYAKQNGFDNVADYKAAGAKPAKDFYDEKKATAAGYKSVADMIAGNAAHAASAKDYYDQKTATDAKFTNIADYNAAKAAGQSSDVYYAEKAAKAAGFNNAADKAAADALKMNPTEYKNHQIATAAGFKNYQELQDSQALQKAVAAGYKNAADQTAAAGKSAKDFYDQQAADAGGYKSLADFRAANGVAAPDFYASKAGFKSASDQSLAAIKNQKANDFYADQTAQGLGYKDAAEQAAAKGMSPADYRAKQLGYADYADQIKAGTMPAADWNNLKAAQAAGYTNYDDMQKALGTGAKTAKDFYSQQKGYSNYAEEVAAKGQSAEAFHADIKAKMAGFDNAEQQAKANGLTAADYKATLNGFANAADAKAAGTQSATDFYNTQKATAAGYTNTADWLAGKGQPGAEYYAVQAGFPDASTQAKAKALGFSTLAQYQAYQDKVLADQKKQELMQQVKQMQAAGFSTLNEMGAGLAGGFANAADYRAAQKLGIADNAAYQAYKAAPPPAPAPTPAPVPVAPPVAPVAPPVVPIAPPVAPVTPPAPPVVSPPPVAPPVAPVVAPPVIPPAPIPPTMPPVVSPAPVVPVITPPVVPTFTPPVAPPAPVTPPYTPPVVAPPVAPPYTPPVAPPYVAPTPPPYVPPEPVAPPYVPPVTPPYVPPAPVAPPYVPPAPVTPPFVVPPASTPIVVPTTPPKPVAPPAPVVPVKPAVPAIFGLTPSSNAAANLAAILRNKSAPATGTPVTPKMTAEQQAAYNQAVLNKILNLT
jgi:hypothetical protein